MIVLFFATFAVVASLTPLGLNVTKLPILVNEGDSYDGYCEGFGGIPPYSLLLEKNDGFAVNGGPVFHVFRPKVEKNFELVLVLSDSAPSIVKTAVKVHVFHDTSKMDTIAIIALVFSISMILLTLVGAALHFHKWRRGNVHFILDDNTTENSIDLEASN